MLLLHSSSWLSRTRPVIHPSLCVCLATTQFLAHNQTSPSACPQPSTSSTLTLHPSLPPSLLPSPSGLLGASTAFAQQSLRGLAAAAADEKTETKFKPFFLPYTNTSAIPRGREGGREGGVYMCRLWKMKGLLTALLRLRERAHVRPPLPDSVHSPTFLPPFFPQSLPSLPSLASGRGLPRLPQGDLGGAQSP